MNKFPPYVPGQHQKVVCRAAGVATWAAQQGREDHGPGWMPAASSGVRVMQSMTKTMSLLRTKFPHFFLAVLKKALQMWGEGQK